jgi:osmotically-inducible protein OsmY
MRSTLTKAAATTALALLLAVSAGAQSIRRDTRDFKIAMDIMSVLNRYDRYTVFDDVTANVKEGVVTLTGKVTNPIKTSEIERHVKRLEGVTDVRNQIQVLPPSKFDDQIRSDVYNMIYGNQNFIEYGMLEKPPIHIVVEGGHVTLTGIAHSEVDRKLAQSLAMQVTAQVTNRLRTTTEASAELAR